MTKLETSKITRRRFLASLGLGSGFVIANFPFWSFFKTLLPEKTASPRWKGCRSIRDRLSQEIDAAPGPIRDQLGVIIRLEVMYETNSFGYLVRALSVKDDDLGNALYFAFRADEDLFTTMDRTSWSELRSEFVNPCALLVDDMAQQLFMHRNKWGRSGSVRA